MILHIAANSSSHIMYPFIKFVNRYFNKNEHFFILCSAKQNVKIFDNTIIKNIFNQENFFIEQMTKADKIILHGIWYDKLCEIYNKYPEFFDKTFWNAWGGDYYKCRSKIHKWFIENVKYLISYFDEDYEFIKNKYNSKAKMIKSVMYPSNLYKDLKVFIIKNKSINIQIGNSADPTNNHIEIFKKIKNKRVKIFCPLAYGNENYKKKVIREGKKRFGKNFVPITKKMKFNAYIQYLSTIDIAIFHHKRQQAMGNTITLLGLGKKVYLNSKSPQYRMFQKLNIKIFDIDKESNFSEFDKIKNVKKIKKEFSQKNLLKNLKDIFE